MSVDGWVQWSCELHEGSGGAAKDSYSGCPECAMASRDEERARIASAIKEELERYDMKQQAANNRGDVNAYWAYVACFELLEAVLKRVNNEDTTQG